MVIGLERSSWNSFDLHTESATVLLLERHTDWLSLSLALLGVQHSKRAQSAGVFPSSTLYNIIRPPVLPPPAGLPLHSELCACSTFRAFHTGKLRFPQYFGFQKLLPNQFERLDTDRKLMYSLSVIRGCNAIRGR